AEQQSLDPIQRAIAALKRFQPIPLTVARRDVQQGEEGWQSRLEGPVQGEDLARHLLANTLRFVTALNGEVPAKQLDDGVVRRGLPVGGGSHFEDAPTLRPAGRRPRLNMVRMRQLPDEA